MGAGEEFIEVTVRDWEGRKLYRERAYKNNDKKIKEIANTLKDKFSIDLVGSIRIESTGAGKSIKERQEEEMQKVREKVQARKEQIGQKVRELFSLDKKGKNGKEISKG